MKKDHSQLKKITSKKIIDANKSAIESFDLYRETMDLLEKSRYPFGRKVIYKSVGATTTDGSLNVYGRFSTG